VLEEGVEHVMGLFLAHATQAGPPVAAGTAPVVPDDGAFLADMNRMVGVMCDEELLDRR
jgi:hypothetical protein